MSLCRARARPQRLVRRFSLAERIRQLLPADATEPPSRLQSARRPPLAPSLHELENESEGPTLNEVLTRSAKLNEIDRYDLASRLDPALATQVIGESGIVDGSPSRLFECVRRLQGTSTPRKSLDAYVQIWLPGYRFPQILADDTVPLWLRCQLLAAAGSDWQWFSAKLRRYGSHLPDDDCARIICRAVNALEKRSWRVAADYYLNEKHCWHGVAASIETPSQWRFYYRNLVKAPAQPDFAIATAVSVAMRLGLTYEVVRVCEHWGHKLPSLTVGRCLVTAAYAQKMVEDKHTPYEDPVKAAELVRRCLRDLTPAKADTALTWAACILRKNPPRNILWALILGSDRLPYLDGGMPLTAAVESRTALEQLRFMTMRNVPAKVVTRLLSRHTSRLGVRAPQPDEVDLLLTGMIILSEKSRGKQREFAQSVGRLLLRPSSTAQPVVRKLVAQAARGPLSEQASAVLLGLLVRHRSYAAAVSILQALDAAKMPPGPLSTLLEGVAIHAPESVVSLARWLLRRGAQISQTVLRKIAIHVIENPALSDRQALRRFLGIRDLIPGHRLGPRASSALVESMLSRARRHGRGSRARLAWALNLALEQNVPRSRIKRWLSELQRMRAHGEAYWAYFPR